MPAPVLTFLDFNLPNATTWFYFSFLLAVALFFKFSRLLSVRNLDVVMIFLLVPGLLLVQTTRPQPMQNEKAALHIAALVGQGALPRTPAGLAADGAVLTNQCGGVLEKAGWLWYGYLWLLVGSVYFFSRCLLDLALVQRPALAPNLQMGGMAWLAGALLICLLAVAYRQAERHINLAPLGNGAAGHPFLLLHPPDQPVFAVAILWRDWPAWGVAALAFAGHVTVMAWLVLIAWRHFQDLAGGIAAATFYLLLPYTGLSVGQLHHVLPMALYLGTLLSFRMPVLTGCLLGIASAATYVPLFTVPIWVSFYRGRGTGRFLTAFLLTLAGCLGLIGLTLWANGELEASLQLARDSGAWQAWKDPRTEGFWTAGNWAYRIPVFLLFISFVLTTTFWPFPKNLAHVTALSAAVIVSLQWWCADQGGLYVLWYMPLLLLMIFRPNLQDRVAPPIQADTDWLARSAAWMTRSLRRVFRLRAPVKTSAG